jgi:hypothetical protein
LPISCGRFHQGLRKLLAVRDDHRRLMRPITGARCVKPQSFPEVVEKGLAHRDRHPATRHILVLHHKDIADTIKQRGKQAFCKWAQEMGAYANTFGRTVPSAAGNPYSRGRRERVPLWNLLPVSLVQHLTTLGHVRPKPAPVELVFSLCRPRSSSSAVELRQFQAGPTCARDGSQRVRLVRSGSCTAIRSKRLFIAGCGARPVSPVMQGEASPETRSQIASTRYQGASRYGLGHPQSLVRHVPS